MNASLAVAALGIAFLAPAYRARGLRIRWVERRTQLVLEVGPPSAALDAHAAPSIEKEALRG